MHMPLENLVNAALDEDIGERDITTEATVPADARCVARLMAKQDGVLSGIEPFRMAFNLMDAGIVDWDGRCDGDGVKEGAAVSAWFYAYCTPCREAPPAPPRNATSASPHPTGVARNSSPCAPPSTPPAYGR